jgi:hypothetical protein
MRHRSSRARRWAARRSAPAKLRWRRPAGPRRKDGGRESRGGRRAVRLRRQREARGVGKANGGPLHISVAERAPQLVVDLFDLDDLLERRADEIAERFPRFLAQDAQAGRESPRLFQPRIARERGEDFFASAGRGRNSESPPRGSGRDPPRAARPLRPDEAGPARRSSRASVRRRRFQEKAWPLVSVASRSSPWLKRESETCGARVRHRVLAGHDKPYLSCGFTLSIDLVEERQVRGDQRFGPGEAPVNIALRIPITAPSSP